MFTSRLVSSGAPAPNYGDYPPDFFDTIFFNECHRGGAKDESVWRRILECFQPALKIDLTATPKCKWNADAYVHFGDPRRLSEFSASSLFSTTIKIDVFK